MYSSNFKKAMPILFFFSFFTAFILVILPIYLAEIGLSGYEIGVLVSLYAITSVFVSFPIGEINDRWSIKIAIILGVVLFSVFLIGVGFFDTFLILIPIFFIGGIGRNLGEISINSLIYKTKMKGKEGSKFGITRFIAVISHSVGAILAATLIFFLDFSLGLKIMGILFLLLIPLASFKKYKMHKIRLSDYEKDFLNKKVIVLAIIMFLFTLHWGAESTSYGLFLQKNLGLNIFFIGLYSSLSLLPLGIAAYIFGKRIDSKKTNSKFLLIGGILISGIFHILHTTPDPWLSFIFRSFHEFGDGMAAIAIFFWISKAFTRKRIGGDFSMMITVMLIGQVVGAMIFGPMGSAIGYQMPLIISGITSIFSAVLLIIFIEFFDYKIK